MKYVNIGRYGIRKTFLISIVLSVLMASTVMAVVQWSKSVPSTVKITGSVLANLYSDSACSTPLTTLDFGEIDRLDLTWHETPICYLKYEGSDNLVGWLKASVVSLPSGFTVMWQNVDIGTWLTMGEICFSSHTFNYGDKTPLKFKIQQTTPHAKGTISGFSFTLEIGD